MGMSRRSRVRNVNHAVIDLMPIYYDQQRTDDDPYPDVPAVVSHLLHLLPETAPGFADG